MSEALFLGRPMNFWIELLSKYEANGEDDLIQEIATLRAKVSFYESRIGDMHNFMVKIK